MRLLTPELYCISALDFAIPAATFRVESRELDFNLSRRSGVLINQIVSQIEKWSTVASSAGYGVQELDLDPDNVTIWQNTPTPNAVEYDSSRVLRHLWFESHNATATGPGLAIFGQSQMIKDWHGVPLEKRPISITPLRHHIWMTGDEEDPFHGELMIYYHIIELSLEELGILNASRR